MKKLVVLTGAGISAESGLGTFRGAGGLWEGVPVEKVATPEGWQADRELVLRFYNERRQQVRAARPNAAHTALAELQNRFEVSIITQNIDDLHERAGSKDVLHLHGEIMKARSSLDSELLYDLEGRDIAIGDKCEKGSQLRPHVVWFGEAVPAMVRAVILTQQADYFAVVGSSLAVYPAASLIDYVDANAPKYIIDPEIPPGVRSIPGAVFITEPATKGLLKLVLLLKV